MDLESCWHCGELPELIEKKSTLYTDEVWKRYACPKCQHKSSSYQATKREAGHMWNKCSKGMKTKMDRYGQFSGFKK